MEEQRSVMESLSHAAILNDAFFNFAVESLPLCVLLCLQFMEMTADLWSAVMIMMNKGAEERSQGTCWIQQIRYKWPSSSFITVNIFLRGVEHCLKKGTHDFWYKKSSLRCPWFLGISHDSHDAQMISHDSHDSQMISHDSRVIQMILKWFLMIHVWFTWFSNDF